MEIRRAQIYDLHDERCTTALVMAICKKDCAAKIHQQSRQAIPIASLK